MDKMTPGLDMPNGSKPENYPQNFVHAPNPNKPGPCNHKAMKAPTLREAMKGIDHK